MPMQMISVKGCLSKTHTPYGLTIVATVTLLELVHLRRKPNKSQFLVARCTNFCLKSLFTACSMCFCCAGCLCTSPCQSSRLPACHSHQRSQDSHSVLGVHLGPSSSQNQQDLQVCRSHCMEHRRLPVAREAGVLTAFLGTS